MASVVVAININADTAVSVLNEIFFLREQSEWLPTELEARLEALPDMDADELFILVKNEGACGYSLIAGECLMGILLGLRRIVGDV